MNDKQEGVSMEDFFYGLPKWAGILIIITIVLLVLGLGGYLFLG